MDKLREQSLVFGNLSTWKYSRKDSRRPSLAQLASSQRIALVETNLNITFVAASVMKSWAKVREQEDTGLYSWCLVCFALCGKSSVGCLWFPSSHMSSPNIQSPTICICIYILWPLTISFTHFRLKIMLFFICSEQDHASSDKENYRQS